MSKLAPYWKLVGAILGGLTPTVVVGVLALVGVHVDPSLATAICTIAAGIGAYIAPANKPAAVTPAPAPQKPGS